MPKPANSLKLLVFEPDEDEEATFVLAGREAVVGRDGGADVLIEDASISSRHAVLRPTGGGYTFTDLGSKNGSALVRSGASTPVPLAAGEATPIGGGDVLLLGDAERPVRVVVRAVAAPYEAPTAASHTVLASAPLADLLGRAGDDEGLVHLAAQALAAATPEALATAALEALTAWTSRASGRGVALWASGVSTTAGDPVPSGVRTAAIERGEVVLFEEADASLPTTQSVVRQGVNAALAAPLVVDGVVHGVLAAWSTLGAAALPQATVSKLSVAATIVGLSAAQLARRAEDATRQARLEAENRELRGDRAGLRVTEPIGQSEPFIAAVELAKSVAGADVPVLIHGETGTGKEVLAKNLHLWSRRAAKPFVAFNCAAVPEALIESELFGHVRGAFTGAGADRKGLFEEADGGTIFLDEIGEMPAVMQAKLLRVLQDGEVRRVGASRPSRVDVRVVSATHKDLQELVAQGRFRADLMYRLNAVTLRIPALRDRGDDVALLAHFLLGRACDQARKRVPGFSADALWALSRHDFPGNVRELENEILRAVALTGEGEPVRASAFSERVADRAPAFVPSATGGGPVTLREAVIETERRVIEEALTRTGGNVSQAARDLGLTRPGLYKVMERLGMRDG